MRVLSLGWGIQSFGLAAMSAKGVLPKIDAAIHADTTHERRKTYEIAQRWTPQLENCGARIVTVKGKRVSAVEKWDVTGIMIPAFLVRADGQPSGMLRRQCTDDWKIAPIRRWLQANRKGEQVEQWLGITLDEIGRMKPSGVKYIVNRYPFIEMFDPPLSRWQVAQWLQKNNFEIPARSSCVFCPYRTQAAWREIKVSDDDDWERACAVDNAIRNVRPGYSAYVHHKRIPLCEVDLRSETDHGQLSLWNEECEGFCFL